MRLASCHRDLPVDIETAWSLVSTPAGLTQWLATDATLELRPGGAVRWTHDDGAIVAGEVVAATPPSQLVFTYGWERGRFDVAPGSTEVTISLTPLEPQRTRVAVEHRGLSAEMAAAHEGGWTHFLGELVRAAGDEQ
ncbi:MAG: SRPBCC domain-containing protein [Actinomycetota bacterium]